MSSENAFQKKRLKGRFFQRNKSWGELIVSKLVKQEMFRRSSSGRRNLIQDRKKEKETQMYRIDFCTLWEKARVGWSERIASKHVHYQVWNRSPVQVGCMRQVLRAGALGWPRGLGWGGWWEEGLQWGTYVNPWLIHVKVWQKPLQYCKVISLKLIKK